jgi:tRNA U34 5-methylaminomethyl-2-thiouridine-forming methyltransferase MnmC
MTLWSERYQQTYHSHFGAGTEARHVYLDLCEVPQRLQTGQPLDILEVGFGAGLNTLLTLAAADEAGVPITYRTCERDPLEPALMLATGYVQMIAPDWTHAWSELANALIQTPEGSVVARDFGRACARLEVFRGPADAAPWPDECADAIYLDAFSPAHNPECWTPEFMTLLRRWARPDCRLSTYCSRGAVRRALRDAGWDARRAPGPPGGKREVLRAVAV